jgi:hypothetical protein
VAFQRILSAERHSPAEPHVKHLRFLRGLGRHIDFVNRGGQAIYLDHPVKAATRYGWGRPSHPGLERILAGQRDSYRRLLAKIEDADEGLARIPRAPETDRDPCWDNGYMSGVDAATLYCFPRIFGTRRYLEVGSGISTRFVRRSIEDFGLAMTITSIDPSPRSEVDGVCDEVIRTGLEDAPLEIFDALEANDILMLDGSHRCFQNSDVTVAFLDVLPRLRSGVLVFLHDIYLPDDYPDVWRSRYYSEQYMLAVLLTADAGRRYEIVFPGHFCETDAEIGRETVRFWRRIAPEGLQSQSSCFWLRVRSPDSEYVTRE